MKALTIKIPVKLNITSPDGLDEMTRDDAVLDGVLNYESIINAKIAQAVRSTISSSANVSKCELDYHNGSSDNNLMIKIKSSEDLDIDKGQVIKLCSQLTSSIPSSITQSNLQNYDPYSAEYSSVTDGEVVISLLINSKEDYEIMEEVIQVGSIGQHKRCSDDQLIDLSESDYVLDDDELEVVDDGIDDEFSYNCIDGVNVLIDHKRVKDTDGFLTDLAMYHDTKLDKYFCMLGDVELYPPDIDYADYVADSKDEIQEWYDAYDSDDDIEVIEDTDDPEVLNEASTESKFNNTPKGRAMFAVARFIKDAKLESSLKLNDFDYKDSDSAVGGHPTAYTELEDDELAAISNMMKQGKLKRGTPKKDNKGVVTIPADAVGKDSDGNDKTGIYSILVQPRTKLLKVVCYVDNLDELEGDDAIPADEDPMNFGK